MLTRTRARIPADDYVAHLRVVERDYGTIERVLAIAGTDTWVVESVE